MDNESVMAQAQETLEKINIDGVDFISAGNQFLTFCLGPEHYGVDILTVKEIRGWEEPTMIPHSAPAVKGVINLRGVIVPVVDLRQKFSVGEVSYDPSTVVIVLAVQRDEAKRTVGFVVDAVSDVLNADDEEIRKAPAFAGQVPQRFISGLVNVGNEVVTILSDQELVNFEE